MGHIKEYWNLYLWNGAVNRLITVNFFVWLAISVGALVLPLPEKALWLSLFVLPSSISMLPMRCWTLITYMFAHVDFMHMLVNMLWLMCFGRLFLTLQSGRRMIVLYIYGGLVGAVAFLAFNALGGALHTVALGASCSVLAIVGAVTMLAPNWEVHLFIFGRVKLLWLGIAAVLFLVVLVPSSDQVVAHGAGLLTGVIYAMPSRRRIDILKPGMQVAQAIDDFFNKKPVRRTTGPGARTDAQRLDQLLDKVSRSGYSSLSASERQELFELSQKLKTPHGPK